MPLYDYKCTLCKYEWEEFFSMKDNKIPLKEKCPKCKEDNCIIRLYSTAGFVDPGILQADKNMEKSGVLKELNRIKEHHPEMKWKG